LKHTWNNHLDYENLSKAAKKIDEIAEYLNEMKREAENMSILMEIQSCLVGKNAPVIASIV
jgi:hypothetical protein